MSYKIVLLVLEEEEKLKGLVKYYVILRNRMLLVFCLFILWCDNL